MNAKWFPGLAVGVIIGCILAFGLGAAMHPIADAAFDLGLFKPSINGYNEAKEISKGCGVTIYPNDGFGPRNIRNNGMNFEGAFVLSITDQAGSTISWDQVWEGADYWQYGTRFIVRGNKIWYLESLDGTYKPGTHFCG